jgi:SAM-dependent methyltransferase
LSLASPEQTYGRGSDQDPASSTSFAVVVPDGNESDNTRFGFVVGMGGGSEFDQLAPVYDQARQPPSGVELETVVRMLSPCKTVLDAGVGTGRYALPLRTRGFEVIGVDLSGIMLRRARLKGVTHLIQADLHRLPLPDGAVDAAFMGNVLHLIPEPRVAFAELGRVSRRTVVMLLSDWAEWQAGKATRDLRARYNAIAAELGYHPTVPAVRYEHTLQGLKAIARPRSVRVIPGPPLSEVSIDDRLAILETLSFGGREVPPKVHAEAVQRLHAEHAVDRASLEREWKARFVAWDSRDLRAA